MKITCIIGSARPNGSTAHLIDKFIEGVDGKAEVRRYCVGDLNISYCLGCKKCYVDGECVQNDKVKNVILDILSSDYVIIAAPSYWADVPAQLKTLFDRTTPYGNTNPKRKYIVDKPIKGIAVAVRAGANQAENELILNSISHYFDHLDIETVKRISICLTETLDDLLQKHQKEIEEIKLLGKSIVK